EVRAVTYTLRYPGETWAQFAGLEKHWERADLVARRQGEDTVVITTKNTTAVNVLLPRIRAVKIDGQTVKIADSRDAGVSLHRENGTWKSGAPDEKIRKRHELSGPIDDAFMNRFVMVRPTGKPFHPELGAWANDELMHATKMWRDIFRADAPVKDDIAITAEDIATNNLILWGDPGSNTVLARLLAQLPL